MSEETVQQNVILDVKRLQKFFPIQKGLFHGVVGYVKADKFGIIISGDRVVTRVKIP